ncbi:hypothetical protein HYH02_013560 [Chlamydomonas schloesseri]|uniref:Protein DETOXIFICATION n=1 Tax=Chlamydomonas schloesseri TaxID=2026947 RepID=A0A835SPA7_9CHLO|nr:hypothetical protein HYH02_013560 [Chlamydomonas schloesseri]|eukprot:KAG2430718.1 hypothetical protein HYH02_013560 [Chlamydomonas schloesseri]
MPGRERGEPPTPNTTDAFVGLGHSPNNASVSGYTGSRSSLGHSRVFPARGGGGAALEFPALPSRPLLPHSASAAALFGGLRRHRSDSAKSRTSSSSDEEDEYSAGAEDGDAGGGLRDSRSSAGSRRSSITFGSTGGLQRAAESTDVDVGVDVEARDSLWGAADVVGGGGEEDVEVGDRLAGSNGSSRRAGVVVAGGGQPQQHTQGDLLQLQPPPVLAPSSTSRDGGAQAVPAVPGSGASAAVAPAGGPGRHRLARAAAAEGLGHATHDAAAAGAAGGGWGRVPSCSVAAQPAPAVAAAAAGGGRWRTPFAGPELQHQLRDQVMPPPAPAPQQRHRHEDRSWHHHRHHRHRQQQQPAAHVGADPLRRPLLEPEAQVGEQHHRLAPRPHWAAAAGGGQQQEQQQAQEQLEEKLQPRQLLRKRLANGAGTGAAKEQRAAWRHELYCVLGLALPVGVVDTVSFLASLVGVLQVGRLGTAELSALTLGSTLFNLTGLSWAVGLTGGMETLCGQLYGAGLYGGLGVTFQRALLVCLAAGAPAYGLWWQAEPLLLALGYVQRAAPCLALSTTKYCCRAYFTSQGVVLPVSVITLVATVLAPLYNLLFITWLNMGLTGAAWAYVADEATAVLLLAGAMVGHTLWTRRAAAPEAVRQRATWSGWDRAAWRGWGAYLRTALPSTAMSCLDWWVLEVMVLLSGLGPKPDTQVAAMGLCFNAFTLVYYAVVGFGDAACTRVSHMLGAGRGRAARRAALTALAAGLAVCAAACGGLAASGPAWTAAFSRSAEVRQAVRQALPYVAVAVLGYSANTVLAGVLRGAGRTGAGLRVNLVTLWLVGLPVAAGLGLGAGWGNVGLWAGIALMNGLQGGALVYKVTRGFNWAREVVRSRSVLSLHASTLGAGDVVIGGGGGEGGQEAGLGLGLDGEVLVGGEVAGEEVEGWAAGGGAWCGEARVWCEEHVGSEEAGRECHVSVPMGGVATNGAELREGCESCQAHRVSCSDGVVSEGVRASKAAADMRAQGPDVAADMRAQGAGQLAVVSMAAGPRPQPAALPQPGSGCAGHGVVDADSCGATTPQGSGSLNADVARWLADAAAVGAGVVAPGASEDQ